MKISVRIILLCLTYFVAISAATQELAFYSWKNECDRLPQFNEYKKNPFSTLLKEKDLLDQIDLFMATMQEQFSKITWIDGIKPVVSDSFSAYIEKLIVPDDAVIAIHGDMHGDIHSLNRFIQFFLDKNFLEEQNPFKIKNKKFYMLFLGDYVDRGWYGAEVLYTILRLKNENPDNVFMVRGNHEDLDINARYGFGKELYKKFSSDLLLSKINQVYNLLPLALYLGAGSENKYSIVQCCHGGIELGFDPRVMLDNSYYRAGVTISHLMRADGFSALCCHEIDDYKHYFKNNKKITSSNGFMWSDFIVDSGTTLSLSSRDGFRGSIFEYGQLITEKLLQIWSGTSYTLRSIFRAHQHSDGTMKNRILNRDGLSHPDDIGLGKLWIEDSMHQQIPSRLDGVAAITFSIAPHTGYGWPVHSFAQLEVALEYSDWRLKAVSLALD